MLSEHRGPKKMNNKKLFIFLHSSAIISMWKMRKKLREASNYEASLNFFPIYPDLLFKKPLEPMPFDFQQREGFRLHVVFVLEDAAVGDAILHHFMRILPSAQEVDAGAGVGDRKHSLVVVLFHDFGAGLDHPVAHTFPGFTAVLHEKGTFVFRIEVFAFAFEGAEMHFLQAFQALVGHQFVRHDFQRIAGSLGCGTVGVIEVDLIKVGTGDSGLLDAELRQRRIAGPLDFFADIE